MKGRFYIIDNWFIWMALLLCNSLSAQRIYHDSSVLATGTWYKISVKAQGVYRIDLPFLRSLGITASNIPSSSIRLYGNGGQMLPESCAGKVIDDLQENAIQVNDGGDGIFNGPDYFLFFANGPDSRQTDTGSRKFIHRKNLYSDQSFYFISFGGTGKRIVTAGGGIPDRTIISFDEFYFYELDTVNLLNSGKNWYGEVFTGNATRTFSIPLKNLLSGTCTVTSHCISRSINAAGKFIVSVNNVPLLEHAIPAVSAGNLDLFAASSQVTNDFILSVPSAKINYTYSSAAYGALGWLDWFEFSGKRGLSLSGQDQLMFRDRASVKPGSTGKFIVDNAAASSQVWDVSDPLAPSQMNTLLNGTALQFMNDCSSLHEYIAFNSAGFLVPLKTGKVENQNLHHFSPAGMIIITHPAVYEQALRLAAYHTEKDHLKVDVVNATAIYNEFASGSPDPTAVRDFVKMYYDKAGPDTSKRPEYLLLFGDASYDYKNRLQQNSNLVPAYESDISADPLATYTSDDFFGFLDDTENIGSDTTTNLLDIGIGRVPVTTAAQARAFVDKVIDYTSPANAGAWRNKLTFIADDEDFNLHMHDAESIAATADTVNHAFTPVKIYMDAYQQESNSSGSRYPLVNQTINDQVNSGTLIWNYSGHGNARRLAEEVVLDEDIVSGWNNAGKLPLFITATCDFAPYDNPSTYSLGENLLLREKTGAIALMATTRLVFAYSNRIINRQYMQVALQPKPDGRYNSLGQAVMKAKNNTYRSYSDIVNNRKFTLLGDPALTLAFPVYHVYTGTFNGRPVAGSRDTLQALQQVTVTAAVADQAGNLVTGFDGTVDITVYDKTRTVRTLGNDPESIQEDFPVQNTVLFKGKAAVKKGQFSYSFIVPKDISYPYGPGKISYYAQSANADGNGSYMDFIIGGSQPIPADTRGPEIKAYLNNESFINGSVTNENPLLLVRLKDSSGINITGTGIGHDVTAVLDDGKQAYLLNDFYESDLNTYQQGTIRYNLFSLPAGKHTLKVKAWDGVNNSGEAILAFTVVKKPFSILRLINFPNPVLSSTIFHLEHDAAVQQMQLSITIFTADGRLIKTIRQTINTNGGRFCDVEWNGKDDKGVQLQKGVYFYKVIAITNTNTTAGRAGKLLIW